MIKILLIIFLILQLLSPNNIYGQIQPQKPYPKSFSILPYPFSPLPNPQLLFPHRQGYMPHYGVNEIMLQYNDRIILLEQIIIKQQQAIEVLKNELKKYKENGDGKKP